MSDITIRSAFHNQSVTIEPTTVRGFEWAREALTGAYQRIGTAYRLDRADAYTVFGDAQACGLGIDNRL